MTAFFWTCLDFFHVVLSFLIWPVRWTQWGRKRVQFESIQDPTQLTADWAFEVSSEGEYEQVRSWIQQLLDSGKKIEIIFASESVEKGMLALKSTFSNQVKLMRLPLLSRHFGDVENFVTAPKFVMCRYDFFPSLMKLALKRKSVLIWATFKNRRHKFSHPGFKTWSRFFYGVFDYIVPATDIDETLFKLVHTNVLTAADFRVKQIQLRILSRQLTLESKCPHWKAFQKVLESFPKEKRIIFGSAWESDLAILEDKAFHDQVMKGEIIVLIAPHKLSDDWVQKLAQLHCPVNHLKDGLDFPTMSPALWLISARGVLCELYAEVGKVYVGGGFERSVHSLLEPFVAGARLWCGPKVHRSTEAELILSADPKSLVLMDNHQNLASSILSAHPDARGPDQRALWLENQSHLISKTINQLKD